MVSGEPFHLSVTLPWMSYSVVHSLLMAARRFGTAARKKECGVNLNSVIVIHVHAEKKIFVVLIQS